MPQTTNLNAYPYYDDFSQGKGYYKVLFRPGYSIQSRELTGLQSILQNQIENYGKSQYKQGQQVVPGEVSFNNKLDYVKLSSVSEVAVNVNGNVVFEKYNIKNLIGTNLRGISSGVIAIVLSYGYASETESDILYVKYIDSGSSKTESTFRQGETLESIDILDGPLLVVGTDGSVLPSSIDVLDYDTGIVTNIPSPSMGYASGVKVESGVYFVNGYFVNNHEELIVVDKYYASPSVKVGFNIQESIITPENDASLCDNSQGFSNYSAPGAHRLQIELGLIVYPYNEKTDNNFIQLISIKTGKIENIVKATTYTTLEETLARRTYDESGDYVVDNFTVDLREYYQRDIGGENNQGIYPLNVVTNKVNGKTQDEASKLMVAGIGSGKAYVKGYEIVNKDTKYIEVEKSRDTILKEKNKIKVESLSYFNVSNVYNTLPLNAEGEDLNSYPTVYLNSVFNDGRNGFVNQYRNSSGTILPYSRRGKDFTTDDGVRTIYVKLNGDQPINPSDSILGTKLWFVLSKAITTSSTPNTVSSATVLSYKIVTRPQIGSGTYIEFSLLGKKSELSLLKEYDTDGNNYTRELLLTQPLAQSYYKAGQPIAYATVVDYNETITPIVGMCKPKDITLIEKGSGFNQDTDIILSQGKKKGGEKEYSSIFRLAYFNPIFFTKLLLTSPLDGNSFSIGSYVYGLTSGSYGIVEGKSGDSFNFENVLFIKSISGEFKPGETILDEDANSRKIAVDGTISHFKVLNRGVDYSSSSKISINGVEYNSAAIEIKRPLGLSTIYSVAVKNRELVSEIFATEPSVTADIGTGAVIIPVLFRDTVTTYTPKNVKSVHSKFGANNKYIFTADVESFNNSYYENKKITDSTFSGVLGFNYLECNSFSADPSKDLIQGDVVQFAYSDNTTVRSIVQKVNPPQGLNKSRIYLDTILTQGTSNTDLIRVRSQIQNSGKSSLIVPTGSKNLSSVVSSPENSKITYFLRRDFVTKLVSSGGRITFAAQLPYGTQSFVPFSENNFLITILDPNKTSNPNTIVDQGDIIYLKENQISIQNSVDDVTGTTAGSVTITLQDNFFGTIADYESFKIKLTATIQVEKSKPRLKTSVKNKKIVIYSPGDRVIALRGVDSEGSTSNVLSYSDVYNFKAIYEGSNTVPPVADSNGNLVSGTDITDKFTFDDGQRDTFYDVARLILKPGYNAPTGQLLVIFDYFEHSQGDFCTVDSYLHESGVSIEEIPYFNSSIHGKVSLGDVFDFRPKVDTTTIVEGYQNTSLLNSPTSFTKSGGITSGTLASDFNLSFSVSFDLYQYQDRIDGIFLNKSGEFFVKKGNSSLNPSKPAATNNTIPLYYLYIPAYTKKAADVNIIPVDNKRYTMRDIGKLERRIERLEDYTMLSILEQQALNMQIKDDFGMEKEKSGFIVDTFDSHKIGNLSSVDYKCAIDPQQSVLRPRSVESSIDLQESNYRNEERIIDGYVNNNGIVTLPFSDIVAVKNEFATQTINPNSFGVSQYVGDAQLYPNVDAWYSTKVFPNILNNDSKVFSVFYAKKDVKEGLSSIYNNYVINWIGTNRVFYNTVSLNDINFGASSSTINSSVSSSSNISPQNNELARGSSAISYNSISISSSIQYFCRSKEVKFVLGRMKPNTKYNVFMDGKSINRWVAQDFRFTGIAGNSLSSFGSDLTTDSEGNASGIILIPEGYAPQINSSWNGDIQTVDYDLSSDPLYFVSGKKTIKFTSNESGKTDSTVNTYSEVVYYATGNLPENPPTIVSTTPAKLKGEEGLQSVSTTTGASTDIKPSPLTQTFKIQNYTGGIFLTGIDLFFNKKSSTIPVRVYLTNVEGGKPGKYIIPGTESILSPNTYLRVYTNGQVKIKKGEYATGFSTSASGPVENVIDKNGNQLNLSTTNEFILNNDQIYTLVISNNNGKAFSQNEDLKLISLTEYNAQNNTTLRVTIAKDSGRVSEFKINNCGIGYESANIIIESPQLVGGTTATASVSASNGNIYDVVLGVEGSGYTDPPAVIIKGSGSSSSGAIIQSYITIDTPAVRMGVSVDSESTKSTIPTKFKFDYPVYLQNDTEYAFAVETDSSDYLLWTSKLGEIEVSTNSSVTVQPLLGSVFKSQNTDEWTEDIFEDIKFNLYRAEFVTDKTSVLKLTNKALGFEQLDINPINTSGYSDSTATSTLFKNNNNILMVSHRNNGFDNTGKSYVNMKQCDSVGGIDSSTLNFGLFNIINSGLEFYNINTGVRASEDAIGGGTKILSTYNRKFEKMYANIPVLNFSDTSIVSYVKTTNIQSTDDSNPIYESYTQSSDNSGFEKTYTNQEHIFNNQKVVASRINELKNALSSSFDYKLELTSSKSYLSPVIDIRNSSIKLVTNLVEKSSGTEDRYGRRDQIITFRPIYKVSYTGSLNAPQVNDIVGGAENIKTISGNSSKARGTIIKIDRTNSKLWVKMSTDVTFTGGETLLFESFKDDLIYSSLSTSSSGVTVSTGGVEEITYDFVAGSIITIYDKNDTSKTYNNVISGKIILWDPKKKKLFVSNNKQPINDNYTSSSFVSPYSRISYATTALQPTVIQQPDIMRVGDLISYNNQSSDERTFIEINNIEYTDGITFVNEVSSKNSSSIAKYTTKEISLENSSDRIDVRIKANIFAKDDIAVLYKIKSSSSQYNFDDLDWNYFNTSGNPDVDVIPSSENVVSGYVENQSSYKEYKFSAKDLNPFSSFAIKIVMKTSNPVLVPKIQDVRIIASY
jgi:hypothetical protein